jgi:hypothetical protein
MCRKITDHGIRALVAAPLPTTAANPTSVSTFTPTSAAIDTATSPLQSINVYDCTLLTPAAIHGMSHIFVPVISLSLNVMFIMFMCHVRMLCMLLNNSDRRSLS